MLAPARHVSVFPLRLLVIEKWYDPKAHGIRAPWNIYIPVVVETSRRAFFKIEPLRLNRSLCW